MEVFHYILDVDFHQDNIVRRNDISSKASRNLDLFQKVVYVILKLYDKLLCRLDKDRKPVGIKRMHYMTSASKDYIREILTFDMSWLDVG